MSEEKDPKKDAPEEDSTEEGDGCDCSTCPGCDAPEKPDTEEKE